MKKILPILLLLISPTLMADQYLLNVEGLVCDFCTQGISKKLKKKFKKIENLHVDLNEKKITFDHEDPITQIELEKIIKKSGYNLTEMQILKPKLIETEKPSMELKTPTQETTK